MSYIFEKVIQNCQFYFLFCSKENKINFLVVLSKSFIYSLYSFSTLLPFLWLFFLDFHEINCHISFCCEHEEMLRFRAVFMLPLLHRSGWHMYDHTRLLHAWTHGIRDDPSSEDELCAALARSCCRNRRGCGTHSMQMYFDEYRDQISNIVDFIFIAKVFD